MSAEIIEFGLSRTVNRLSRAATPALPVNDRALSETARNGRMRKDRRTLWRKAAAATEYWHTYLKFTRAVGYAQDKGVLEALKHPKVDGRCYDILDAYRDALHKQMLTPAPDMEAVIWKRTNLKKSCLPATDVERIQKAIAKDIAFLEAHPTRRSRIKEG